MIDFMLGAWPDAAKIDADRIGFFGFRAESYRPCGDRRPSQLRQGAALRAADEIARAEMFAERDPGASRHTIRIRPPCSPSPGFTFLFGPADLKA